MKKLIYEFIGTFFLCFTIGCAVAGAGAMAPLAIGAALMVMVYAGGHLSGANYNPAVSLALFLRGKLGMNDMLGYMAVQVVGGILGSIVACTVSGSSTCCAMGPGANASTLAAILAELLGTFALVYVVLNVATTKANDGNSFYGLAIGFTVAAMAYAVGGVSGGSFNPAVGIGRCVADMMQGGSSIGNVWLYLVGPFLGGVAAAFTYNFCNSND